MVNSEKKIPFPSRSKITSETDGTAANNGIGMMKKNALSLRCGRWNIRYLIKKR